MGAGILLQNARESANGAAPGPLRRAAPGPQPRASGFPCAHLRETVPDHDAIIAPSGGGGLMSGTSSAARGVSPGIRIFAGEPKGADDAARSLAAGDRRVVERHARR